MNVQYHENALQELRDIIDWYNAQRSGLGSIFLDKYESALEAIIASSGMWPNIEQNAKRYLTDQFPYGVIYTVDEDHIRVIAISHTSRRVGYWRSRLKH